MIDSGDWLMIDPGSVSMEPRNPPIATVQTLALNVQEGNSLSGIC